MTKARTDGIYIHAYDQNKGGYYTTGKNGKLIRHKYTILDKLYDVFNYGEMRNMVYSYFVFRQRRGEEDIRLYRGSISMELSKLIEDYSRRHYSVDSHDLANYYIENDALIITNKDNSRTTIRLNSDSSVLWCQSVSKYDGTVSEDNYRFYPFLE